MFTIMLKGNEFFAKVDTSKNLILILKEKNTIEYRFNLEEKHLECKLENKNKLIIRLTDGDVKALSDVRLKIINLVKHSVKSMSEKTDKVKIIKSESKFVVYPDSVYQHLTLSEKFVEGMLFVLNSQLDKEYTFESLQQELNETTILNEAKFLEGNELQVYETTYDNLLKALSA